MPNTIIKLIWDLLKSYPSLEKSFGTSEANAIMTTLHQYGIIGSNFQEYSPSALLVNLAQMNSSQYKSLVSSMINDLGSTSKNSSIINFGVSLLKNLGNTFVERGFVAAVDSGITFLTAYFINGLSQVWAGGAAAGTALDDLLPSISGFLEYMLPLAVINAIYLFYVEPISQDIEAQLNIQNAMYNIIYPAMFSDINNMTNGNVANLTDGTAVSYEAGIIQVFWYMWFNEQIKWVKGEYLDLYVSPQIIGYQVMENAFQNNLEGLYKNFTIINNMSKSLVNDMSPAVHLSLPLVNSEKMPYLFTFNPSKIEYEFTYVWNQASNDITTAAKYADDAWNNLSAGIQSLSKWFTTIKFGMDPPSLNIYMDGFNVTLINDVLISSYPMASVILGNNTTTIILPGNLSGYVMLQSNLTTTMQVSGYSPNNPQDSKILLTDNITKGNVTSFYYNNTASNKQITVSGYSNKIIEQGLPSGSWQVSINNKSLSINGTFDTNSSYLTISNLPNGTYTFTITNLTSYYTTNSHFITTVDGNNVTETVHYYHWAYIAGTIYPGNAILTINGKNASISPSGYFNVSVANGTYHLVVSEKGHKTYYRNLTMNPGSSQNLTIDLKPVSKPSSVLSADIYNIIGIFIVIGVIAGAVLLIRKRK